MKKTTTANMNLPEYSDNIDIEKLNDNFKTLDSLIKINPVHQSKTVTDINVTVYPPYYSVTNSTDEDIEYTDYEFFEETFTIEAGKTDKVFITEATVIHRSSDTTLDYEYFIRAEDVEGGGGSGGTTDYAQLTNKPSIGGITLVGNKTATQLGLATETSVNSRIEKPSTGSIGQVLKVKTVTEDGKPATFECANGDGQGYIKPTGGIPSSDMSQAVQASLGKADTALQVETHTGDYSKPSGGIPASDMTQDIQTKLSQAHSHSNKAVLDEISSTVKQGYDSAYTHSTSTHARTDATKVAPSTTNGNIKINDNETTVYSHPTQAAKASGMYKIIVDGTGHVSGADTATASDLGYTNTSSQLASTDVQNAIDELAGELVSVDGTSILKSDENVISVATDLQNKIANSIQNPQTGTVGQVLAVKTVDESGKPSTWETVAQSGGSGGTTDYSQLTDKPSINGTTLVGNKTAADLGLATSAAVNSKIEKPSSGSVGQILKVKTVTEDGKPETFECADGDGQGYIKPAEGIPKADLSKAVQTSLGKADTALQAEVHTGDYSKPSGGIPATDMSQSVQTALGQAHSHSNKSALDNLTQTVINNSHSHSNKSALDNLTQTVINNSHTHSNKTVLDGITSSDVSQIATNKNNITNIDTKISDIYNRCAGGKNVLRYSFDSKTEKGMTITVDDYTKNKISVTGTATSSSAGVALACRINGEAIPSGGMTMDKDYNLVFTNNSLTNCKAMVVVSTSSGTKYYNSTTGTKTYSIKAGEKITTASVQATSTSSAVSGSVEVMLAPDEIGDSTYTPYTPTNYELYKMILDLQADIAATTALLDMEV